MRIEMIVPSLDVGGMEAMVVDLANTLAGRGNQVGITCLGGLGPFAEAAQRRGLTVTLCPDHGWAPLVRPGLLAQHLHNVGPDIIHAHSGAWLKAAAAVRHLRRGGLVYTAHGLLDRVTVADRVAMHLAARLTDQVAAVSPPLVDFLAQSVRVRRNRLRYIPNGIDCARFSPGGRATARTLLGLERDTTLLGMVGRLVPVKNHVGFLDVFASLVAEQADIQLVIIGDGPNRGDIEGRVDDAHSQVAGLAQDVGVDRAHVLQLQRAPALRQHRQRQRHEGQVHRQAHTPVRGCTRRRAWAGLPRRRRRWFRRQ